MRWKHEARSTKHERIVVVATVVVGAILYLAAIAKTISPSDTQNSLAWVFSDSIAYALTIALILGEIILASVLLAGLAPRLALGAATLLSTAFLAWILYLHWIDAPVDCGCGVRLPFLSSGGGEDNRAVAFARAGMLLVVSGVGWWCATFQRSGSMVSLNTMQKGEFS